MSQTCIKVPAELFAPAESSSFTGEYVLPSLQAGPDSYTFAQPLAYNVTLTNTGGALLVSGTVTGVGVTSCVRCLEDTEVDIDGVVEGYFLLNAEDEPDQEWEDDEFEVIGEDNIIDLAPLLDAAILIDIPVLPLCSDDCKGLCPTCGIDLNKETCDCADKVAADDEAFQQAANPFAALKDLKFGDE